MSKSLMSLTVLVTLIAVTSFCPTFGICGRRPSPARQVSQASVRQSAATGVDAQIRQHPYAIVKLSASWCAPCKSLAPLLQQAVTELRTETGKAIAVFDVDIEQQKDFAAQYSFSSVPTLLFFQQGSFKAQQSGAPNDVASVKRLIRSNLPL